jgi:hypothetical protein
MRKSSTAEYAEIAELFPDKDKKHKSFYRYGLFFAFCSSGDRDKRVNEEEAGSAKIIPGKPIGVFDHRGRVRKKTAFPRASYR